MIANSGLDIGIHSDPDRGLSFEKKHSLVDDFGFEFSRSMEQLTRQFIAISASKLAQEPRSY
jgi:hypothetical protein